MQNPEGYNENIRETIIAIAWRLVWKKSLSSPNGNNNEWQTTNGYHEIKPYKNREPYKNKNV